MDALSACPPQLDDRWQVGSIKTAKHEKNTMVKLSNALADGENKRIQADLIERRGYLVYEY